jgi:uncharacterized membrane protein (DUF485 family)
MVNITVSSMDSVMRGLPLAYGKFVFTFLFLTAGSQTTDSATCTAS